MNLLASKLSGNILDFIVVALLIFFALIGLRQGFVNRVVGVVSGIIALILAFSLCKPFSNLLESLFGLNSWLGKLIAKAFKDNDALNVKVADAEQIKQILADENIPSFIRNKLINSKLVSSDKTIAQMLGSTIAKYCSAAIAFMLLLVSVKLVCMLLRFVFTRIEDKFVCVFLANKILGICFAFLQCLVIIYLFFFVINILPSGIVGGLQRVVDASKITKMLTSKNLFKWVFGLIF